MDSNISIGVVFITYNAKHHLRHCLPPILSSPLQPRVLVLNSSSKDGTVEEAQAFGVETLIVPRKEFNHGTSRNLAWQHLQCDITVMMTPDAYACQSDMLEKLAAPLIVGQADISYARQIPHDEAKPLEELSRSFNYPEESHIRSLQDMPKWGVYTFFCSNSCAAWRTRCLAEIGGFPNVLTGEDTMAAAALLRKGYKIAYCADAVVKHSHDYTLLQEFKRYFDTGYVRKEQRLLREMIAQAGRDESRGKELVLQQIKTCWKDNPGLLPKLLATHGMKFLGYKIGSKSHKAPTWFKRSLSGQDFYWK